MATRAMCAFYPARATFIEPGGGLTRPVTVRLARGVKAHRPVRAARFQPRRRCAMAKSQKKSSKEIRKPKAEKPPKGNASNPSQKGGVVKGLDNMKKV